MAIIEQQVQFPPKNVIAFFQDFRYHRGLPSGVTFTITGWRPLPGRIRLSAPGYGANPYGNGQVFMSVRDLRYAFP